MELLNLENLFFTSPDWVDMPKFNAGDSVWLLADHRTKQIKKILGVSWGANTRCWMYLIESEDVRVALPENNFSATSWTGSNTQDPPAYKIGDLVSVKILDCDRTLVSGITKRGSDWAYMVRYSLGWIWLEESDLCLAM